MGGGGLLFQIIDSVSPHKNVSGFPGHAHPSFLLPHAGGAGRPTYTPRTGHRDPSREPHGRCDHGRHGRERTPFRGRQPPGRRRVRRRYGHLGADGALHQARQRLRHVHTPLPGVRWPGERGCQSRSQGDRRTPRRRIDRRDDRSLRHPQGQPRPRDRPRADREGGHRRPPAQGGGRTARRRATQAQDVRAVRAAGVRREPGDRRQRLRQSAHELRSFARPATHPRLRAGARQRPLAGSRGNSMRYLAMAPRDNALRVRGSATSLPRARRPVCSSATPRRSSQARWPGTMPRVSPRARSPCSCPTLPCSGTSWRTSTTRCGQTKA